MNAAAAGIGWRHPHHQELLQRRPPLPFLEVHSENFFADGGAALHLLNAARADYEISLHGVGLGLGSATGLDPWHLDQLARLVERVQPLRVSDHACFARVGSGLHAQDLLPICFDDDSLARLIQHVDAVQQRLKRPLLVEHLSAYVGWDSDRIAEPHFFNQLTERSGCQLLLDLNNLLVNAKNRGGADAEAEARDWISSVRVGSVGEIHVAGHACVDGLFIDDHGSAVPDAVWRLLDHARGHLGPLPVLVEWDTDIPSLDTLLAEAAKADAR